MKRSGKTLFISIAVIAILVLLFVFYSDRVIAFSVNRFTPCRVTYDKWGNPFDRTFVDGFRLELTGQPLVIDAKKAFFRPDWRSCLREGKLELSCDLEGVNISFKKDGNEDVRSPNDVFLDFLTGPERTYDRIGFIYSRDKDTLEIRDFSAASDGISIEGSGTYKNSKEHIILNVKVSVSPDVYNGLPEDIRDKILSPDDDGRYSTVIDYKGNIILLRALYALI